MDVIAYFESLGLELAALQKRVRYLIADAHWQTDGEWKESAIRQVLRRHLPSSAVVGRGFIVSNQSVSTQIDVLIRDAAKPVVFSDGDLAFVTPDAVLGLIEVKSSLSVPACREAARKLAANIELVRRHPNTSAVSGLFSFEGATNSTGILESISEAAATWDQRIDVAAVGESTFVKYWHFDPSTQRQLYQQWHAYVTPGLSAGYFIHNVVEAICPDSTLANQRVWFPPDGKEQYVYRSVPARWATTRAGTGASPTPARARKRPSRMIPQR